MRSLRIGRKFPYKLRVGKSAKLESRSGRDIVRGLQCLLEGNKIDVTGIRNDTPVDLPRWSRGASDRYLLGIDMALIRQQRYDTPSNPISPARSEG